MIKNPPIKLFNKFKDNFFELYTWITETLSLESIFDLIQIVDVTLPEEDPDNKNRTWCYFAFYTRHYMYAFTVVKPYEEEPEGFISAEISLRKPPAGEKTSGSNSLTGGGVYSEQTWINFLKGLVKYEIVELAPSTYKNEIST